MINDNDIEINDLGEALNEQFQKMHEKYLGLQFDGNKFISESLKFFDENDTKFGKHDEYFQNFTVIWKALLQEHRHKVAEQLWNFALKISYEWEEKNSPKRIHKGTAYYFAGVTLILARYLENGFLLMHQALEEDKLTHSTDVPVGSPAFSFVTLDFDKQNQYFRSKVLEIAEFLEKKICTAPLLSSSV